MPTDVAGDRNRFAEQLFASLPKRYDQLAEVLSMGQNGRWRRAMVDHIAPTSPARMLDVASGTAGVALQLVARTSSDVVGVDLTRSMLARGQENVAEAGMSQRISLVAGRAEQLPFPDETFDALTFTYLLRYVDDPQATLCELARVVKPGGAVASLEFLLPPSRFWRFWWWLYTRLLLPVGGLLTGGREWFRVGRFLGPNISQHYRTYPLSWTEEAWQKAGFEDVGVRVMSLGGGLVMWEHAGVTEEAAPDANDAEISSSPPEEPHAERATEGRPAFYAARAGGWRDWWTLLHPPYTAWHLAYVVIGACLAPTVNLTRLLATLLAFFLAVGLAAHSLDELNGRPLGTHIPTGALIAVTVVGLAGAVALGVAGVSRVGWPLVPFLVLGPLSSSLTTWSCSAV